MFILMPIIFVSGILLIALEDKIKINKAAVALFMAISLWMILMYDAYSIFVERNSPLFQEFLTKNPEIALKPITEQFIDFITNRSIVYHLGNVSETLFFVMCSMLIVDIVDKHGGFKSMTSYLTTTHKRRLLWTISFSAFFKNKNRSFRTLSAFAYKQTLCQRNNSFQLCFVQQHFTQCLCTKLVPSVKTF